MQQKTLGGDRLGSGAKMKVGLTNYERSTHDLSYAWRSTMSAGTLVPFLCKVALPGDTADLKLQLDIKTLPTIGPLYGSYKVDMSVFSVPIRLYNALTHNNALGIGLDMSKVKLPQMEFTALPITGSEDPDNAHVNPSSILAYLGIRGFGQTSVTKTRQFNITALLAYWDIYKNYFANKQETNGAVIHKNAETIVQTVDDIQFDTPTQTQTVIAQAPGVTTPIEVNSDTTFIINFTGATPKPDQIYIEFMHNGLLSFEQVVGGVYETLTTKIKGNYHEAALGRDVPINWDYQNNITPTQKAPNVGLFPLTRIDEMRNNILSSPSEVAAYLVNDADIEPYKWVYAQPNGLPNILNSQEGLALKTYQSDLHNNWLQTTYVDTINQTSAVSTAGGSFTMDTLNLAKKVYNLLNRVLVSGGTYTDWIESVYTLDTLRKPETPVYMGGMSQELSFQEVVSNSAQTVTGQPLGTLAGKGTLLGKPKGGNIYVKFDEPSYLMGIVSLTPRVDYSQGNAWDVNLLTLDDLHKPALDQIGFQDLITEQLAWWDTVNISDVWTQQSAGKQPAWINYMTSINQTYGNFAIAKNQMFMTLNRRYEFDSGTIADLTTYIDPTKHNFIFAQTSIDAQNFQVQIGVNLTMRRKMSAKIMPNL